MKQKEERDLENALAWDEESVDPDTVLEAVKIDKEESERFFKEAGQIFVDGKDPVLLEYRRKRVNGNLAKLWFIYEHLNKKEVRLLSVDQRIDGEKYSFVLKGDEPIFSYE